MGVLRRAPTDSVPGNLRPLSEKQAWNPVRDAPDRYNKWDNDITWRRERKTRNEALCDAA